jgi:hypothetical protein
VAQLKYLETIVINQNVILEELKKRINSVNACSKTFVFYSAVYRVTITIYKLVILSVVLYWCESLSLTLWKDVN